MCRSGRAGDHRPSRPRARGQRGGSPARTARAAARPGRELLGEAPALGLTLDLAPVLPTLERTLDRALAAVAEEPAAERIDAARRLVLDTQRLGLGVSLWAAQNRYFEIWRARPAARPALEPLGEALGFALDGEVDRLMRVPLATYRLQLGPHLTFDDVAALAALSARPRRGRLLHLAVLRDLLQRQPRLRRQSTTTASTPSSADEPAFAALADGAARSGAWACCSTWCPTTWASRATNALLARRARRTGPTAPYARLLRHRLGAGQGGARAARCCCRSWATVRRWCSSAAELKLVLESGGFNVRYYDTVLAAGAALLRAHPRATAWPSCTSGWASRAPPSCGSSSR